MTPATVLERPTDSPPGLGERWVSYEEYLSSSDYPEHSEWVDGFVEEMPMVTDRHDKLTNWFSRGLGLWVEERGMGEVKVEPYNMKTGPHLPGRAPDVMFIAREHLDRVTRTHLRGPADLVIEIVSPESVRRDKVEKFAEYEEGGVPEYWWVDPMAETTGFYQIVEGKYQEVKPGADGIYHSRVLPGVWIDVAWLWQSPLPRVMDVLRLWGLD